MRSLKNGDRRMKPIRLATLGIIAAASMFGALAGSAAPVSSPGVAPGRNLSRDTGRLLVGLWRPALPVWRLLRLPALLPALPVPLLATKTRRGCVAPSAPILPNAGLSCPAFAYLLGQGFRV